MGINLNNEVLGAGYLTAAAPTQPPDLDVKHAVPGPMKYWAFISYSHRDARVAAKLSRWIESFRLLSASENSATPI